MDKKGKPKKEPKKKKLPPGVRERDGRYTFRFSVKDKSKKSGRRQKETESFPTAQAAYDAGILIKAQQLQGKYVEEDKILFEKWVEKWLGIYERSGKKKKLNTIKVRKNSLKRPLERWTGRPLKEITAFEYQELLDGMKAEGLGRSALEHTFSSMRMLFERAKKKPYSLIKNDITEDVEFPDFSVTVEELEDEDPTELYLEKDELSLFLRTAEAIAKEADNDETAFRLHQWHRALFILSYSGLRIGELCGLEDKDILEEKKQIRIIKNLNATNGVRKYVIDTPKNDSSVRNVDVSDRVLAVLKTQIHERKKFKLLRGDKYRTVKQDFVFINARNLPGCPMSPRDVEEHMKEVLKRTGLPLHLTPHNLRHTYVSLLAEAGMDLDAIRRQIGHTKDTKTTMIYKHVTKDRRRAPVEVLDALMDSAKK